jgi:quercetin dioxygenase-like cupin family protein
MRILKAVSHEREPADPAHFTGTVHVLRLAKGDDPQGIKVFRVEFEPGARTHWHVHTGPQILVVTEGICRAGSQGGPVVEIGPGEAITIAPGENHWHGAGPGSRMVHLAINVRTETTWFEAVSEDQYARLG